MLFYTLAILIFASIYMFVGKDFTPAVINEVQKDTPAMQGGLKKDDIILEIDGNKVKSIMDVSKYIMMSTDDFIDFKVKRSYDELLLKIKPNIVMGEDNLGNKIKKRISTWTIFLSRCWREIIRIILLILRIKTNLV